MWLVFLLCKYVFSRKRHLIVHYESAFLIFFKVVYVQTCCINPRIILNLYMTSDCLTQKHGYVFIANENYGILEFTNISWKKIKIILRTSILLCEVFAYFESVPQVNILYPCDSNYVTTFMVSQMLWMYWLSQQLFL